MKKTVSPKQLAANRANAAKSTGPRTPEGRAASARNATQHGICSAEVVLCDHEDFDDFGALHQRFTDHYQPEGPVEELLVDQIVTTHWRLRRVLTAEAGETALGLTPPDRRAQLEQERLDWQTALDPIQAMEASSHGCRVLSHRLREVRTAVVAEGELTATASKELQRAFGVANWLTHTVEELRLKLQGKADPSEAVLAFLDVELKRLAKRQAEVDDREITAGMARKDAAMLPAAEALEKLGRYETRLNRQLFRALTHLERLQKERRVLNAEFEVRSAELKTEGRTRKEVKSNLAERTHLGGEGVVAGACGVGRTGETAQGEAGLVVESGVEQRRDDEGDQSTSTVA